MILRLGLLHWTFPNALKQYPFSCRLHGRVASKRTVCCCCVPLSLLAAAAVPLLRTLVCMV